MREIATIEEFKADQERLRKCISYPAPFPLFNFHVKPKALWFFDYFYIFELGFFSTITQYCKAIGENGWSYLTLDPDPVDSVNPASTYYTTFASATFSVDDDPGCLGNFLAKEREVKESPMYNLKDSPGKTESIMTTLNAYGMLSNASSWVIYGEYGLGRAMLATFVDAEANTSLFPPASFLSIKDAADWIKALGPQYGFIDPDAFFHCWQE